MTVPLNLAARDGPGAFASFQEVRQAIHMLSWRIHEINTVLSPKLGGTSGSGNIFTEECFVIPDEELNDLDCLLADLTQNLHDLRSRAAMHRNDSLPVHRMPPEVLSNVFEIYVSDEERPRHHHPAFTLSWVCAYWRSVSIGCSAIWSRFGLSGVRFPAVEVLFQRSREHSLQILRCGTYVEENVLFLMLSNLYRIKNLDMGIYQDSFAHDLISGPLPSCGSSLERVSLHFPRPPMSSRDPQPLHVLKKPLFDSQAPQLRYVELDKGRVPWNTGYLSNLSALRVTQCPVGAVVDEDKDVCLLLRDSPQLEVLQLGLYKNTGWDSCVDRLIVLHLKGPRSQSPCLHTLHLDVPTHYALHLLSHFEMPFLKVLRIDLGNVDEKEISLANMLATGLVPKHLVSSLDRLEIAPSLDSEGEEKYGLSGRSFNGEIHLELKWTARRADSGTSSRILQRLVESLRNNHDARFTRLDLELNYMLSQASKAYICGALSSIPTVISLRLIGTETVSTVSSTDGGWISLNSVSVDAKLDHGEAFGIVNWCRQRRSISALDFSDSKLLEHWDNEEAALFVQAIQNIGADFLDSRDYYGLDSGTMMRAVLPPNLLLSW